MRIIPVFLGALLLLAGCAPYAGHSRDEFSGFQAKGRTIGDGPEYVDVEASFFSFSHRVDRVELVAPDGARTRAPDVATVVEAGGGRYGGTRYGSIGIGGGSGGLTHVGVGLSLGWLLGGDVDPAPLVRAKATVPVPDPAAYRREWKQWQIAVTLSREGAAAEERTAPAPAP